MVYALLLHKKVMALATIDSVATTKTLCSNLREITTYCSTVKGNIELLHSYFNTNYYVPYPSKVRYTPATMGAQTPR
jgi:hypothetical protein